MRIAFIRPTMAGRTSSDALQPLIFSVMAALTPPEVNLDFHDAMKHPLPEHIEADAIAITVDTFSARSAYQLADDYRQRGVPVVMGGYHPTLCPDEAAEHCDALVIGEAEDTWPQVLADLADNRLQPRYLSSNDNALDQQPSVDLPFNPRDYPPLGVVQFSRGCRYTCEFCSIHAFYGHRVRSKPVDQIVAEVASRRERLLFFADDNLFADRERACELFEALIPLKKRWVCQISMDVARSPELLALMRRAGAIMVLIGFESLDEANLRQMRKGANVASHDDYAQVIAHIRDAGLMIYGTFVIGYDHDTPATAQRLVDFATRNQFSIANFNPLMPMPGTALFDRLAREGRLLHDRWWIDEDFRYGDAMFIPAGMTPAELTTACRDARFGFYGASGIARRTPGNAWPPANLGVHLLANLISRREIHAKQGARLGAIR